MSPGARVRPERRASARHETEVVELSREECLALIGTHRLGRVVVVMPNGAAVIRPVNYVFDRASHSVVFRSARGSKLHALLHAPRAKFEVDDFDEAQRTGWSVIIEGPASEVASPDLRRFQRLGLDPWAPGAKPHWVQVRATTVSGRQVRRLLAPA